MRPGTWREHAHRLEVVLAGLVFTDALGCPQDPDEGFAQWLALATKLRRERRVLYLLGNGASASMASHFAADLGKNGGLHTEVFTDPALITAIGNDLGYDRVFAEPLLRRAQPGDLVVAISSSGCSQNILAAADVTRRLQVGLVTLTGMSPDNPLRAQGQLNLYVPAVTYGEAETTHAAALHWWMDRVQADYLRERSENVEGEP